MILDNKIIISSAKTRHDLSSKSNMARLKKEPLDGGLRSQKLR